MTLLMLWAWQFAGQLNVFKEGVEKIVLTIVFKKI